MQNTVYYHRLQFKLFKHEKPLEPKMLNHCTDICQTNYITAVHHQLLCLLLLSQKML